MSTVVLGGTVEVRLCSLGPLIWLLPLPGTKTSLKEVVHVEVPIFLVRQVLVKAALGPNTLPSGTLWSAIKAARSGPLLGVGVLVGPEEVAVAVGGVPVTVGVGVMLLPVTTMSTQKGLSPAGPMPKGA